MADKIAALVRTSLKSVVLKPISWMCGERDEKHLKRKLRRMVEQGTGVVVSMQKKFRHPFLNAYFAFFSFTGEREVRLIARDFEEPRFC